MWVWWVVGSAAVVVITAYSGLLAWQGYLRVSQSPKRALYVCDVHGPTQKYEVFPEALQYVTAEGVRRNGKVEVCVLCFENMIKEAGRKLPPVPKTREIAL